jgi:hypothetical protein
MTVSLKDCEPFEPDYLDLEWEGKKSRYVEKLLAAEKGAQVKPMVSDCSTLPFGTQLHVLDHLMMWNQARVLWYDEEGLRVHYEGFSSEDDEVIPRDQISWRVRQPFGDKDESCDPDWHNMEHRYQAKIRKDPEMVDFFDFGEQVCVMKGRRWRGEWWTAC